MHSSLNGLVISVITVELIHPMPCSYLPFRPQNEGATIFTVVMRFSLITWAIWSWLEMSRYYHDMTISVVAGMSHPFRMNQHIHAAIPVTTLTWLPLSSYWGLTTPNPELDWCQRKPLRFPQIKPLFHSSIYQFIIALALAIFILRQTTVLRSFIYCFPLPVSSYRIHICNCRWFDLTTSRFPLPKKSVSVVLCRLSFTYLGNHFLLSPRSVLFELILC